MTLQLQISHTTGFMYEGGAVASYNEARMTPVTAPGQFVLSSRLDVTPSPHSFKYLDYWGAMVTAFEVAEAHDELLVHATSVVQVNRMPPRPAGLSWEQLADPDTADRWCEYLAVGDRVRPSDDLVTLVAELRESAATPSDLAPMVCEFVRNEVEYEVGSTEVNGTAEQAWENRRGVCQDLVHLAIGALRTSGVPARYVSGYLHPVADPVIGETVTGESHAWLEWWDGQWIGFDPTNLRTPDDHYVVVAAGRDYADVAPLTGIFSGVDTSSMFVEVSVTRLA
ncbi:MAG: transglutaminase family protein [Nocardioidaceae bacterium]